MVTLATAQRNPFPGLQRAIRVLIIDDSAVARAALSQMIESDPSLSMVGVVDSAARAIAWLTDHRTDVVLLDLEMPGWTGLAALPDLLIAGRGAKVLVVSSTARIGAEATLKALAAGAADTLAKPAVGQLNQAFQTVLVDRIGRLGRASLPDVNFGRFDLRSESAGPVSCLGIGASTGGLRALGEFLAALPQTFGAPIAVTQHLPPSFMPFFAEQLAMMAGRSTHVAEEGRAIEPGEIVVAPGTRHLRIVRRAGGFAARLSDVASTTRCCPSVDPMFASMAEAAGTGATALVLSGMGRDGTCGATQLVEAGGSVLVQDSASSVVWGMPGSVAKAGLACIIDTPARLAQHLGRRGSA